MIQDAAQGCCTRKSAGSAVLGQDDKKGTEMLTNYPLFTWMACAAGRLPCSYSKARKRSHNFGAPLGVAVVSARSNSARALSMLPMPAAVKAHVSIDMTGANSDKRGVLFSLELGRFDLKCSLANLKAACLKCSTGRSSMTFCLCLLRTGSGRSPMRKSA